MVGNRLNILVSGMLSGVPCQGGASWAVLQYLLGFEQLGHQVSFLEPIRGGRRDAGECPLSQSVAAAYFSRILCDFGLQGRAALVDFHRRDSVGLPFESVQRIFETSDVLINLAGWLAIGSESSRIPLRVYVDIDPGFTQFWHEQGLDLRLEGHNCFVTIGSRLGAEDCPIPTLGLDWKKSLQPVVLRHWPDGSNPGPAYSTVANWRSYGTIQSGGVTYGQKVHSWRPLMDLPRLTGKPFQVALAIGPEEELDLKALQQGGWELVDPALVASHPHAYRDFISRSRGEIAIAKSGYVLSGSGWFSERSACYLAMGKPVIAEATGFEETLPCGRGLLAFSSLEQARQAVEEIEEDYPSHARAARQVAEECFESDRVLSRLLHEVGALG